MDVIIKDYYVVRVNFSFWYLYGDFIFLFLVKNIFFYKEKVYLKIYFWMFILWVIRFWFIF